MVRQVMVKPSGESHDVTLTTLQLQGSGEVEMNPEERDLPIAHSLGALKMVTPIVSSNWSNRREGCEANAAPAAGGPSPPYLNGAGTAWCR